MTNVLTKDIVCRILRERLMKPTRKFIYDDITEYLQANEIDDPNSTIIPCLWFWDPLSSPEIEKICCPKCKENSLTCFLSPTASWEDFSSNSLYPRTLRDTNWHVLLVGRVYSCAANHKITSYHAGILSQLDQHKQPFLLSHKSGITKSLFDFVIRSVESGTKFSQIEQHLRQSFFDKYCRKKLSFNSCQNFPDFDSFYKPISNDMITLIFLVNYDLFEHLYEERFSEVKCRFISIDHTFKAAANVGFKKDGKWIKQYDSLFIAMNESGCVKGFQYTMGTGFDHVFDLLKNIAAQCSQIETIFTDNCCQIRNKLSNLFPTAAVKLDIYHAIARLTKHMPKRHPFHFDAVRELGLVFREESDIGIKRQKKTPQPEIMKQNLTNFLDKWKQVNFKGWFVINKKVLKEFENLGNHVTNGCLSGIDCFFYKKPSECRKCPSSKSYLVS